MSTCQVMEYLGYVAALYLAAKMSQSAWSFLSYTFSSALDVSKLGKWGLVTGSTDGIGKAYAFALAKRGLNVILVSRNPYKLQNVAAEIESKHKVKTKIVDIDFTQDESVYVPRLEDEIKGLDIGVLVNNVGMSYDYPEEFLKMDSKRVRDLFKVNMVSVDVLTRLILPQMAERKKGAVINISSMSAIIPSPLLTVYAASKAYVDKFTENLELEYRNKGIVIQCVLPGYVVSNMSKIKRPTMMAPSPETFVNSALSRLGVQSHTTGYFMHEIMAGFVNSLPYAISSRLVYGQIDAIRKKALKKQKAQ